MSNNFFSKSKSITICHASLVRYLKGQFRERLLFSIYYSTTFQFSILESCAKPNIFVQPKWSVQPKWTSFLFTESKALLAIWPLTANFWDPLIFFSYASIQFFIRNPKIPPRFCEPTFKAQSAHGEHSISLDNKDCLSFNHNIFPQRMAVWGLFSRL